jgi:hypothetical protein
MFSFILTFYFFLLFSYKKYAILPLNILNSHVDFINLTINLQIVNDTKHIRICFLASQTAAFHEAMILAVQQMNLNNCFAL